MKRDPVVLTRKGLQERLEHKARRPLEPKDRSGGENLKVRNLVGGTDNVDYRPNPSKPMRAGKDGKPGKINKNRLNDNNSVFY